MFFISITKSGVAQNFQSVKVEEFNLHSSKITVITDKFLSDFITEPNGFSVVESPLINTPDFRNNIFLNITYDSKNDSVNIFKSTISGRPIYYHINPNGEFFCSTHISMLRSAGVPIAENTDVLPEFFVFRFVMPPNTLYKNIYQLFSGGQLQIKIIDSKCHIKSINLYNPPTQNIKIKSITESALKLYDYLSESIKKLKIRKNETAVLLSGGIDSSVLSAILKINSITRISYSTRYPFEDPKFDLEKKYSLSAAQALGMKHHYYEPTNKEYLIGFLEAVFNAEEPLHHLQSVLFHLLFKKGIREEKQIIVNGQGAGTTFGSNSYLYIQNRILFKLLSKSPSINLLRTGSKFSPRVKNLVDILNKPISKNSFSNPKNPIWSWMDYGNKNWACQHFNVTENDIIKERYKIINEFQNLSVYDIWSLYSFFGDEQSTLSIWSKIGEGNKKIIYTPYYDQTVLDYAFSIPWKLKLHRPEGYLRKKLAYHAQIPKFIINRPKSSFGVQPDRWAKKDDVFESLIPLISKVFDEKEIRKMQSSEPKKAMTYWNMLNYSIWKRLHINNELLEVLLEELNETI
ncbi:Asparagine synthase [uncultured archaeon]|nr:Asparagine synthase [uncultured archaeon]